jgi:hypothetical protein
MYMVVACIDSVMQVVIHYYGHVLFDYVIGSHVVYRGCLIVVNHVVYRECLIVVNHEGLS